jgi:plastocyanin
MPQRFSVLFVALAACSGPSKRTSDASKPKPEPECFYGECKKATPRRADSTPAAAPKPAAGGKLGPVGERAQALREAADLLDKAQDALANGNRNLADQLFSTAELITGPDALAAIAGPFREGAPPRVTTPTQKVDPATPRQPRVLGSSEAEDEADRVPPPPRADGSLSGTLQIDGKAAAGTYGLVTLEPASGKWKPRTPKHVVIEQRNREFLPKLVAVSVGSTIAFPNFDATFHNVFSASPLAPFDLGLYKMGEQREFTFTKEGFVRLGCNLHANMQAYIAVVSAPAYVVTDEQGKFAFRRLAPGKYKLRAWSVRSAQPVTKDITIKAGKNELTVGVSADAPAGPAPDKFGGKRG